MDRRAFLKWTGALALVGGLESVLTSCAPYVDSSILSQYQRGIDNLFMVEKSLLSKLEESEYVIPDDVLYLHTSIIYEREGLQKPDPKGVYINFEDLLGWLDGIKFKNTLIEMGYSKSDTKVYAAILAQKGNIVISTRTVEAGEEQFRKVLQHERMHREITNLPEKIQEDMELTIHRLVEQAYSFEEVEKYGLDEQKIQDLMNKGFFLFLQKNKLAQLICGW